MNSIDTLTWVILAGVLVVAVIALAAWLYYQKKQSRNLQKRVGHLNIVPLQPAEAARFSQAWKVLQRRFVDNPKGVVVQADRLVRELMLKRGYPMGDFAHRAADISVDHPSVVENYRAAQAIALRDERGEATTEDLRKAVVHYRALFNELLEARAGKEVVTERK